MKELLRSLKAGRITIFSTHILDLALICAMKSCWLSHGGTGAGWKKATWMTRPLRKRLSERCGRKIMIKTLKISFSLRNTYRVNSILYSLKQIPLVKRLLPAALYQVRGLKNSRQHTLPALGGAGSFLGKGLYLLIMVAPATYGLDRRDRISSHSGACSPYWALFPIRTCLMGEKG